MRKLVIMFALGLLLFAAPAMSQQVNDNFWVTIGAGAVLDGGGSGFNDGEWYVYPSMWINEWFYDHPFTTTRGKIIHIEFDWVAYDPACTTDITVAVNWSTPAWSALGYGATEPPLPGVNPETDYIVRHTMLQQCGTYDTTQHFVFDYVITEYNPEWVSIDVRGCNFVITNGLIRHECAIGTENGTWGSIKEDYR
jgi:hypothetical protein